MQLRTIRGHDFDDELKRKWRNLQASNPDLVSPFFCPEFSRIIGAVGDVEVAVAEENNEIVGLFPFQRRNRSLGIPVGGIISDYQGIICAPGFLCDPLEWLRKCSLCAWDFDHLLPSQESFAPFHRGCELSPQMSLTEGFGAYMAGHRNVGSEQTRKIRRMEREIGALRFVSHTSDTRVLRAVLAWKSRQYRETSKPDLFQTRWIREAVERIHATQETGFAGMLSALYAGERLVASHFGMRSERVWHWWFPAYDPAMSKYSPGLILLLKMAEHAHVLGVSLIDLGKGMSLYKHRLMNASVSVASGSVALPSWLTLRRRAQKWLRYAVANSPLAGPARAVVHRMRDRGGAAVLAALRRPDWFR